MQGSFFLSDGAAEVILQKSFAEELLGIPRRSPARTTQILPTWPSLFLVELTMRYAERSLGSFFAVSSAGARAIVPRIP